MYRSIGAPALCLAAFGLLAAVPPATAHEDEETAAPAATLNPAQQAVADVLLDYARAYQATDLDAISALVFSDERFSYFEGSAADHGWIEHRKHLAAEFPSFSETRYRLTDIQPVTDGGMAYATYRWTLDVTILSDQFEGGRHPVSMRGLGTAVFERDDECWRIRHIHTARDR